MRINASTNGLFIAACFLLGIAILAPANVTRADESADEGQEKAAGRAADDTSGAEAFLARMSERWDGDVGLWTRRIHSNANRLVRAGNLGVLDRVDHERVLANLRRAQQKEGPLRGNFWWNWADRKVTDRNSGFFTTVQLLALHHEHRDMLSEAARADLDHMLSEAMHWFRHKVYPITEKKLRYPNAYFGDAMCLWLLSELRGEVTDELAEDFHRIVRYYLDKDWGWGEHLSDLYAKVIQRELVALLLWQKQLPAEVEADVRRMMTELCQIDAWYEGGPRVPAVRNYHLDRTPGTRNDRSKWFHPYKELMTPDTPEGGPIAQLGYKHGLHKQFPVEPRESSEVTVDTYEGSKAFAWVEDRWRLGVLSWYPFFPDMQQHAGYGLAWQSMPVAFWHADGDWAYLQWAVKERGKIHAHPGMSRQRTQGEKLARLSDVDPQATVANTRGIREGRHFLVVRDLPVVAESWQGAADRLRLVAGTPGEARSGEVNGWDRLVLPYGEETLTVAYYRIRGRQQVVMTREGDALFWGPRIAAEQIAGHGPMTGLWYLTVDDAPAAPPTVTGEGTDLKVEMVSGRILQLNAIANDPWGIHMRFKPRIVRGDAPARFHLPIVNPADQPMTFQLDWSSDHGAGWNLKASQSQFTLAPRESKTIALTAAARPGEPRYPLPKLAIKRTAADSAATQQGIERTLPVIGTNPPMTAAKATAAPKIDGALDDAIWQRAANAPGFGRVDRQCDIAPGTEAWAAWDDEALYLAFRCHEPEIGKLKLDAAEHDGKVFQDDSVEVMIEPDGDGKGRDYFQIIVSAANVVFDGKGFDNSVTIAGLETAAAVGEDAWTAEIAIPWKSLGLDGPPENAGILLARNRQTTGEHEIFQYPLSPDGNHQPGFFAELKLQRE